MSIRDALNTLDVELEPRGTGNYDTDDVIKFHETNPDKGYGTPIYFRAQVTEDIEGGATSTLQILIQDSANGTTWATIASGPVVPTDSDDEIKAGVELFETTLPKTHRQWVRARAVVGTAAMTAGEVHVWFAMEA